MAWPALPICPDTLDMLMIRPARALIIGRITARVMLKAPVRLTVRTSAQALSVIRMTRSSRVMPALLTRMSTRPSSLSVSSTIAAQAAGEARFLLHSPSNTAKIVLFRVPTRNCSLILAAALEVRQKRTTPATGLSSL